jgi:hypothetical protein
MKSLRKPCFPRSRLLHGACSVWKYFAPSPTGRGAAAEHGDGVALAGTGVAQRQVLLPGDADVPLDLQQALTTIYDIIGYDELLDYRGPPPGPLTPAEMVGVEEQLRRVGRRAS